MPTLPTVQQLQFALRQMLPSTIKSAADKIADGEDSFDYPEESQHLKKAVRIRRNEFITSRRCARTALSQLGVSPLPLPPDENRIPRWPAGFIASISHCRGVCCAVAANKKTTSGLGIDLEQTTRMSNGVMKRILHPLEVNFAGMDQQVCSLLFSAKEAFFKTQFPIWGVWPNFEDLAFQADPSTGQLIVAEVATHLPESLQYAASKMRFRHAFIQECVVTLCWLDNSDFPLNLEYENKFSK